MNTLDDNDPRLTAYALDELDAVDRRAVEEFLAGNAGARAAVAEIRETAEMLRDDFRSEAAFDLGAVRIAAILGNTPEDTRGGDADGRAKVVRPSGFSGVSRFLGIAAVAACLCLVSVVGIRQYLRDAAPARVPAPEREAGEVTVEVAPVEEPAEGRPDSKRTLENPAAAAAGNEVPGGPADRGAPSRPMIEEPASPATRSASPKVDARDEDPPAAIAPSDLDAMPRAAVAEPEMIDRAQAIRRSNAVADDAGVAGAGVAGGLPEAAASAAPAAAPIGPGDAFGEGFGSDSYFGARGGAGFGRERLRDDDAGDSGDSPARGRMVLPPAEEARAAGERYAPLVDNPFVSTWDENVSTFSIDVDTGAYSNARRFVSRDGQLPPKDAVRIEEMINYFDYDYPQPADGRPFSVNVEVASCPWEKEARLVRIGLQGRDMHPDRRPPTNLVFLIDVSGSMAGGDKLELLQSALMALVDALNEDDSIAIAVYAGSTGLVLDSTPGDLKDKIKEALGRLQAGGSTNGGEGIALAYETAKRHFIEGGVNRVVLATDGDFNVGITDHDALVRLVEERAKDDDIFLTVLGFGTGNLNDRMMEQIADKGNGNYFYIDNGNEGRRVLVDRLSATLVAIAKDVKVQVDFNPAKVARYRLIGYANRMLENKDFRDDTKDAGEIGAGHSVTALYQVLPAGTETALAEARAADGGEASKYLRPDPDAAEGARRQRAETLVPSEELLTVRLRYKQPDADESVEFESPVVDPGAPWEDASDDFRFAAAVAGYGLLLRDSEFKGRLNYDLVLELADEGKGRDPHGLRAEFIEIAKTSKQLANPAE